MALRRRSSSVTDTDSLDADSINFDGKQIDNTEAETSPDHSKQTPKRLKRREQNNKSSSGPIQTTISFAARPTKQPEIITANQIERLFSKIDELKTELKTVVKTADLDDKLQHLVTKDLLDSCVTSIKSQVNDETDQLKMNMKMLYDENRELKERLDRIEATQEICINQIENVKYKATKALELNDDLEQHGRANSVRVYGVKDTGAKENTYGTMTLLIPIFQKIGCKLDPMDIDTAHRLGKYVKGSNRGIICKFVRRVDKDDVIKNRKKLKHSGMSICEDLTNGRRMLLNETEEKDYVAQAWTVRGNVIAKSTCGNIRQVKSETKTLIEEYERRNNIVTKPVFKKKPKSQGQNRPTGENENEGSPIVTDETMDLGNPATGDD